MFNKKGQAALEFLTTYGWAFLVILVMIGALSYFGVLNPENYIPDACNFGSVMSCSDNAYSIESSSANNAHILIKVSNIMADSINITEICIKEKTDTNACTSVPTNDFKFQNAGSKVLGERATDILEIDSGREDYGLNSHVGGKKVVLFDIEYSVGSTSTITKTVQGSITTNIQ